MTDPAVEQLFAEFVGAQLHREYQDICWAEAHRTLGFDASEAVFTIVGATTVPGEVRAAVSATIGLNTSLLKITAPVVGWFRPESFREQTYRVERGNLDDLGQFSGPSNLAGRAIRSLVPVVMIRADLDVRRAMMVAAHESRHLAQPGPAGVDEYVENEMDARTFEQAFAAAYLNN